MRAPPITRLDLSLTSAAGLTLAFDPLKLLYTLSQQEMCRTTRSGRSSTGTSATAGPDPSRTPLRRRSSPADTRAQRSHFRHVLSAQSILPRPQLTLRAHSYIIDLLKSSTACRSVCGHMVSALLNTHVRIHKGAENL